MSEPKPKYITKRGQPSLEAVTGQQVKSYNFKLVKSDFEKIETRAKVLNVSVAEYLRRLIATHLNEEPLADN